MLFKRYFTEYNSEYDENANSEDSTAYSQKCITTGSQNEAYNS
ncbi:hypothetical protein T10_4917 [Trichinella papuae]|uniref:Uncharacterized protein n=1 Tax=Trichinella papuae TaxID=268474 RepID=A0A0V1MJA2_9BILA|nr:hypothetical protein T10_4917 [Trichinella papuae]